MTAPVDHLADVQPDLGVLATLVDADYYGLRLAAPTAEAFEARETVRALVAATPMLRNCEPLEVITCPHGCRFVTAARPHMAWGPWRMQVHLMLPKCPTPMPGMSTRIKGRR